MSAEDAAQVLSEFVYTIDNLPAEIAFLLEEIGFKDEQLAALRAANNKRERSLQKHQKQHGVLDPHPNEAELTENMRADGKKIQKLADEKVALAEKGYKLLAKHVSRLDGEFERLRDMGYNVGEPDVVVTQSAAAIATHQANAALAQGQLKRKAPSSINTNLAGVVPGAGSSPLTALGSGNPYGQQYSAYSSQPGSAGLNGAQGQPFSNSQLQNSLTEQYAALAQYTPAGLTPQQQQQYQQALQSQFSAALGQVQANANAVANATANRPQRPSRLSSSFSASGVTSGVGQHILPTNTAAHLPNVSGQLTPGGSQAAIAAANKRLRPAGAVQGGPPNKKKKKRITISDEESIMDDGVSEDAADAEDDDSMLVDDGTETKGARRGLSAAPRGSRAGTPLSNAPTPGSVASAHGPKFKMAQRGRGAPVSIGLKADDEEEDADAEGEEDWQGEGEDGNGEDPTLYCVCHRVSYGNMIACDSPTCKIEWFHWSCMGITKEPEEGQEWICPYCRQEQQQQEQQKGRKAATGPGGSTRASLGSYQQLQQQQQQIVAAAQQARESGRATRRG